MIEESSKRCFGLTEGNERVVGFFCMYTFLKPSENINKRLSLKKERRPKVKTVTLYKTIYCKSTDYIGLLEFKLMCYTPDKVSAV